MNLSQSSKTMTDPLSDVLNVLGARVTRRTRLEASGQWALNFPALDRLKFVAVLRGSGWILLPGRPPQFLTAGDVYLLGRTDFAVASDPALTPVDGYSYCEPGCDLVRLGGDETISIAGTVTFERRNADFLLGMLPHSLYVPRSSASSGAMMTILSLMNDEIERDVIGSEVVSGRLADMLLVEALRAYAGSVDQVKIGWLGALVDKRLGRVLRAIHGDIAHPWSVSQLAGVAGMSRAAFSADFTRRVGQSPLAYVRSWRLTIARAALGNGKQTVASVANNVGYASQSAFAQAFKAAFGIPPKADSRS